MDDSKPVWIDPATALRLMREYWQKVGTTGATAIEADILLHTNRLISRKTLENWLNGREPKPTVKTQATIREFMGTAHFRKVVPRVHDYLAADARLCRLGEALSELYGAEDLDPVRGAEINAKIAGWWVARRVFDGNSEGQSFLCITPVETRPFSKVHVFIRSDEVPIGSGIAFPKSDDWPEFLALIYSRELYFREKSLLLKVHRGNYDALTATFSPRDNPVQFPGGSFINVHFSRVAESLVPAEIKNTFDGWNREVLPRDRGRLAFFGEGSRNAVADVPSSQTEAFDVVRRRDKAIEDNYDPTED